MDGQITPTLVSDENLVEKLSVEAVSNKSEEIAKISENELRKFTSLGILGTGDDDNVSGDGLGKESDGNIDEDELLKDTESDTVLKSDSICCAEEEEAILESNSDSSNALHPLNKETYIVEYNVLSNSENIRTEQPEKENEKSEKNSKETLCDVEKNSNDNIYLNKNDSDYIRSSDKICIETKNVLTVENEFKLIKCSSSVLKMCSGSDELSVNNDEHLNKCNDKNVTDKEIENVVINKGNNIKESIENERVRPSSNNNMEENENVSTFLHVDQEDTRPDDCLEAMELSVEDPFAQTAEDCINNIVNDQITPKNNAKTTDTDHVSPDSNKVIADNRMSLNCDENINEKNTEVDCTKNNIGTTTTPQVINSMEIEPVESNNSSTGLSQVTPVTVCEDKANSSNKEDCIDTCTKDKHIGSVTESASQNEPLEKCQNKNNIDSNELICEKPVTNDQSLSLGISKNNDTCIVPDKDLKQIQEPNIVASAVVAISTNSFRSKSIKLTNKTSKAKSKKSIEDESSDDSDFEVSAKKSTTRPKRDAAKKAESQIKVSFC